MRRHDHLDSSPCGSGLSHITITGRVGLLAFCLLPSACGPHGPTTTAFDGTYHGTSYVTDPGLAGELMCSNNVPLNPMTVTGGHVVFGNVTGWVQPDGSLQMVFGPVRVYGQFQGTHFQGLVYNPQPACNYRLEMSRAG
jgi:hypothetical protein